MSLAISITCYLLADPLPKPTEEQKRKLSEALTGLLNRTFSSDLLPPPLKQRRAMICAKVDPAHFHDAVGILDTFV
jgi:hypothetical protein